MIRFFSSSSLSFEKQNEGNGSLSFYEMLGVDVDVDESGLKVAFRQVAKKYHPDHHHLEEKDGEGAAEVFVMVRQVFEALKDPVVRFAYDRFGPRVLSWKSSCSSRRDFVYYGILQAVGYWIVSGVTLLVWSMVGRSSAISFWRWILFILFLSTELMLILSSSPFNHPHTTLPTPLSLLFPRHRVIFQHILFLHHLYPILNIILSRIVPLFFFFSQQEVDARMERAIIEKTRTMVNLADREASITLHTDLHSITTTTTPHQQIISPLPSSVIQSIYSSSSSSSSSISTHLINLIIEHNLKLKTDSSSSGPLRSIWERARKKKNFWQATSDMDSPASLILDTTYDINVKSSIEEEKEAT